MGGSGGKSERAALYDDSAIAAVVRGCVHVRERDERGEGLVVGQPQKTSKAAERVDRVCKTGDVKTGVLGAVASEAEDGREGADDALLDEAHPVD